MKSARVRVAGWELLRIASWMSGAGRVYRRMRDGIVTLTFVPAHSVHEQAHSSLPPSPPESSWRERRMIRVQMCTTERSSRTNRRGSKNARCVVSNRAIRRNDSNPFTHVLTISSATAAICSAPRTTDCSGRVPSQRGGRSGAPEARGPNHASQSTSAGHR